MKSNLRGALANSSFALALCATLSLSAIAEANLVRFAIRTEPPNLDSTRATDQQSSFVLGHVQEGLTRYDKTGKIVPGVAEKWVINDKGATFNLRKNAKWADGKPVTAKDFVFAWRKVVDPKTASEYASFLFPVKNGEKISKGEMPTDQLGVTAVDDQTLKVDFETPCGHFLTLTPFTTLLPVREDFYNAQKDDKGNEKYAADAKNHLSNGPFQLTEWVHGSSLKMVKNPNYWNPSLVKVDGVDVAYITPDPGTHLNFFKDKKLDVVERLDRDTLKTAQSEKITPKMFPDGSLWYLEFNHRQGRTTTNKSLRKAISAVYDANEYIQRVISVPGTKPAFHLIPGYMPGTKGTFRKEYPIAARKANIAEAKKLVELAKQELGGTIPPLVYLTDDTPAASQSAEYFQEQLKKHLGLEVRIDKQIFKQRLAKMTAGEFDMVMAGWGPDYQDPMTFADLFTTWNGNNRGKFKSDVYDQAIRDALATTDQKKRMDLMAKAEKNLLEEAGILPLYERVQPWLIDTSKVDGVVRRILGADPDFTYAIRK